MISLYDILEASNGQLFGEPGAQIFTEFCIDASRATDSSLYLALGTDRGDTHAYIAEAIENGATGVISNRPPDTDTSGISVIMVRDTIEAVLAWAHYVLGKTGVKVIGVSGSIGKSVTCEAVSRVLGSRFAVHTDTTTGEGRLSIPLALAHLNNKHKFVVLKLSPTQPGEMTAIVEAVQPEVGVVTDAGELASTDPVADGRALVEYLSPSGLAILNYDNDAVRAVASSTRAPVRTMGIESFGADMMAYNIVVGPDGTGFDLRCDGERQIGHWTPLLGRHHLYSVMAALTIGQHYDIPLEEGLQALKSLRPLPGHMNPLIGINDCLLIDDTYNANTQSTLGALDWMSAIREEQGRVIFVMGNMDGGNRNGYRKVGQRAAHVADVLITQGMDAAQSARAALDQGMDQRHVHVTYSMQDTVNLLEQGYQISAEDIILLKGSVSSHLENVARSLLKDSADAIQLPRQGEQAATARFEPLGPSWVEIDTDAIAGNVQKLKDLVGDDVTLMAVVKSNGYGHGAVRVARTAMTNGADYLGVSSMQEALELREAGVDAPILTLNYTPTYLVRHAIQYDIALTLYDLGIARAYDRIARELNGSLRVHIKVDTGMGRLGAMPDETVTLFRHLIALRNLDVEGIYTHFSMADEDPEYTETQIDIFKEVYRPLQATTGIKFKYIHAANSAATIATPESYFSMVRCGLAIYGMHPSTTVPLPDGFRPALTWKTVISQVKTLPPGHPVGYGNTYVTFGEERIAIIPVGYGDGLRRGPKNWGQVLVHGERVFVLGRVSMEKTALRIPDDMEIAIGDEVVLLGSQGDDTITAEEVAERLGTINYEVTCGILPRAPRL